MVTGVEEEMKVTSNEERNKIKPTETVNTSIIKSAKHSLFIISPFPRSIPPSPE